jgi:dTDP-4-dehydrorhamnose 3,5-epimerase
MVDVTDLQVPGVRVLRPARYGDARGWFSEVWRREWLPDEEFVQDNHSASATPGTVRGLHFQVPPAVQGKLVRVARGAILDVAVDLRVGSPTFGGHAARILSAANGEMLWAPPGCAHGFCTLEPDTEVLYKVSGAPYAPDLERGLAWDDPGLGIAWPAVAGAVISDRDRGWPAWQDLAGRLGEWFRFEEERS